MPRPNETTSLPEPPWTQAPSEVLAWGRSTGGRPESRHRPHRASRVKSYEERLPVSQETRLLRHLARLGLDHPINGPVHLPHAVTRLVHRAPWALFGGRFGGTRLEVRLRTRARLEVRVTFTPQIPFRRAWRIVARMGLHPTQGTWM